MSDTELREQIKRAISPGEVIYEHEASGNYAVVSAGWFRELPERLERAWRVGRDEAFKFIDEQGADKAFIEALEGQE